MKPHDAELLPPGIASGPSPRTTSPAPPLIGSVLARKPAGPKGLIRSIEKRLGYHALIAAGVRGGGPWRLATARYDLIKPAIATFNLGNWMPVEAGAVVMFEAEEWAARARDAAESAARGGSALKAPWFLFAEDRLEELMLSAAAGIGTRAITWRAYCDLIERKADREIGGA